MTGFFFHSWFLKFYLMYKHYSYYPFLFSVQMDTTQIDETSLSLQLFSGPTLKNHFFPGIWKAKTMEMQAILTVHFSTCQHRSPLDWTGVFRYQCLSAHGPRPAIVPTATFGAHSIGCVPKVIPTCGPHSW